MARLHAALVAVLLCAALGGADAFFGGSKKPKASANIEVYRIWEVMSEPAKVTIPRPDANGDIDDFLDSIERELRKQDPHGGDWRTAVNMVVARDGSEIDILSELPEKVFVLCMGESYFFPTDKVGEKFNVKLSHSTKKVEVEVLSNTPQLLLVKDFMSAEETDAIINAAKPKMERSTVEEPGKKAAQHQDRTSSTAWIRENDLGFMTTLKERVQDLVKVPKEWSEDMQVIHYAPYQHYKVHHDYITAYNDDPRWAEGYNRMITVLFYLTTVDEGGETVFPYGNIPKELHHKVPKGGACEDFKDALKVPTGKGNAVIFYHTTSKGQQENQFLELDPTSLHGGCDPIRGDKWAANFWIRNGPINHGVAKPRPRRRMIHEAEKKGEKLPGVDESWPTQRFRSDPDLLKTIQQSQLKNYDEFIEGCEKAYNPAKCKSTESIRIDLNAKQPAQMVNYTRYGFKKTRVPADIWPDLQKFWQDNKNKQRTEPWPVGNTFTNHWIEGATIDMVNLEHEHLQPMGKVLRQRIWDSVKDVLEQWTGMRLRPVSCYGIRIYRTGHILAPHVDRQPLVTSAIINVDQDVDEDWPLEVIGHDGVAYNVTMEAGDLVLYESHSIIHGRPYPMKGRHFANVFVHFEPYSPYIRGKPHPNVQAKPKPKSTSVNKGGENKLQHAGTDLESSAHYLAGSGQVAKLEALIVSMPKDKVHLQKDVNDWAPIHEAARGGHLDVVKVLVKHGAPVHERTNGGQGWSPLGLAKNHLPGDHPVIQYFEELGAPDYGVV
eukprot:CAMPEP_0206247654 /NCGR_PEP_ID=MMETSP0047_2-20121206/19934_1 /ASSEMBLY_ACC=CAM_ASM_000192 /TAXON_ID=195065 /ORGANISM="Chroomonas mesostigmatica_cf, Strain CCMP1168" /LENGTH=774 /DNA_ID=CAMNT_0053673211 /DNA_START=32 /DNA_END=2356 /DNA_ORIENTATION=-